MIGNYIYPTVYTHIVMKAKKSKPNFSAIFDKIEFVGFTKEQKRAVKKKIKESIV